MKPFRIKLPVIVVLIACILLTACSAGPEASSDVIGWQPYHAGLQSADAQGKKTFLYFRADW